MGLGLGYGSAEATWDLDEASFSESGSGLATDLRLGGCWGDRLWIYYSNSALFFEGEGPDDLIQGLIGLGAAWFFNPAGRSLYLLGEIGAGVHRNHITARSEKGFGYAFGAGIEFRKNWVLEANFMRASVEEDPLPEKDLTNFSISFGWIGY